MINNNKERNGKIKNKIKEREREREKENKDMTRKCANDYVRVNLRNH
jgi:hypothetical protein